MADGPAPVDPLRLSQEGRIDHACDRYEAAWKAGLEPSIETFLDAELETERPQLFRQLLALELELRGSRAERPQRDEYLKRFPGFSLLIEEAFAHVNGSNGVDATISEESAHGAKETPPRKRVSSEGKLDGLRIEGIDSTGANPHNETSNPWAQTQSLLKITGKGKHFGRYRLLRVLGQGAFGRVYLAFDDELQRQVAIKVPTPDRFQNPGDADRYLAEARVVATLDHTNIVPVYDLGRTADGSIYVVSKFIEGCTLAERIPEEPSPEEASRIVAMIAMALDHAHRKRLIHRDVKPANILIDEASRNPYVADFGLAITEEASLGERNIAGTPAYMSPEQVRGEGHRLDGRSDIFSLGVVFYELLTGKKPFRGSSMMEVCHQVLSLEPPAPRTLKDSIPAELERICLKAMSKRASDRYATAMEMADDLLHWRKEPQQGQKQIAIVPRGLRSFGPDDADFFLDLLPGTRGRDGLPESIRFWKSRIEETDSDKTFDVGLIYGPSGCGKSSLVKAGLLPNLKKSIVAIYVEATAEETEIRILRGLRKRLPDLPEDLGLVETFALLRRGNGSTDGRKVVVVMDQFEQWLHARRAESDTELVNALRQCDGAGPQAIVMVRDDFSMAASRFMRELETPIVEGHNFATVDLFDQAHAGKVLMRLGQAFGRLPLQLGNLSTAEKTFINAVANGLAQDGKVVSVRLSLFAEMVKDKPWVPATLDEVGGTEGIGVNFLEETFSGRKANPEHRLHQQAARQVLTALLPDVGTDIKGHMRSHAELLPVSGYENQPGEFNDLLRILDGALRLITPTDPDGVRSGSGSDAHSKFYQLTHDYLVPSLREWLTRKQKETPEGRAELRLTELAALWNAKRENRRLPGWSDYRSLLRLTDRKQWSQPQQLMMRRAARYHSQAAVRRLIEADLVDVPKIVVQVHQLRKWTWPLLRREQLGAADQGKVRLHTALAMLAMDESQLDYLYERLLQATPAEFPILRDALFEHRHKLSDRLWSNAEFGEDEERRLRAAAALATYDSANSRWSTIQNDVAQALTKVSPEFLGDWKEALRAVRAELLGPLAAIFRNQELGELQLALATSALADYAANDVILLADLVNDANPQQFAGLFPVLARHGEAAVTELERELEKVAEPQWADPPTNPDWREVPAAVERAIEVAAGMLSPHFAFCQEMPQAKFRDIVEEFGRCGYRPTRIRPYFDGRSTLVAAVWTRDGHPWQWLNDADAEQILARDAELRRDGYIPVDASVVCSRKSPTPRYTAVWERVNVGETEVRLIAGPLGEKEQQAQTGLVEDKFNCLVTNAVFDVEGHPHGCSLWTRRKDQQKSTTRIFHGPADEFRADDCPGLLMTDAQLSQWPGQGDGSVSPLLLATALWNVSTQFESRVMDGLTPEDLREIAPQLAAEGFRPVSISTVGASPQQSHEVKK